MNDNDYIMWLNITLDSNSKKIYDLLKKFESPANIFNAKSNELSEVKGIKSENINKMFNGKTQIEKWKAEFKKDNIEFVSVFDNAYPEKLKHTFNPPVGLYFKGKLPDKDTICVGIVGSRRCSEYGKYIAEEFSFELAKKGLCVVSGMAAGIDTISNSFALKANGYTIAVLGFGHKNCYPLENRELMKNIALSGCVISEYPPDTPAKPYHFPQRNNIIAGICDGILVVEAAQKSGALITANLAANYGRSVMAVPSNITSPNSAGVNTLIKDGCCVVTKIDDIIFELGLDKINLLKNNIKNEHDSNLTTEEKTVLSFINTEPVSFEYIINKTNMSVQDLQSTLIILEIKYKIKKLPGNRFVIK